jgi:hypothetical protein
VEIKRTLSPKVTSGLLESMETLRADRAIMVIPQGDAYPLSKSVTAIGLIPFLQTIISQVMHGASPRGFT